MGIQLSSVPITLGGSSLRRRSHSRLRQLPPPWHAVAAIDVQSRKVLKNIQFEVGSGPKRIAIARRV